MVTRGSRWRLCLLAQGLLLALPAHAISTFSVNEPWVRLAADGRSAEAFMRLTSSDGAALVAVACDATRGVVMRGPGAQPVPIAAIPLPAGSTVLLAPAGYRLGLPRLERALKLGDRVLCTLTIERGDGTRQEIAADAEVRRRSPTDDHLRPRPH